MKYWRKGLDRDHVKPGSYEIHVINERCKGCRFCIELCPQHVLSESTDVNHKGYHPAYAEDPARCLNCGLCGMICPEFAISVTPLEEEKTIER
ncbi:MAG: ferredoxin family protein [Chloroflexota bacterium]